MSQTEKNEMFNLASLLLDDTVTTWKIKRHKENIYTTTSKSRGGTTYKININCACSAEALLRAIMSTDSPMVTESTNLGKVDDQTDIIRVLTAPSPCNFIKSKELINLRSWKQIENSFLVVARSLNSQNIEEKNEIMIWQINYETPNTCTLIFIMNLNFKGTINVSYMFFKAYVKHIKGIVKGLGQAMDGYSP